MWRCQEKKLPLYVLLKLCIFHNTLWVTDQYTLSVYYLLFLLMKSRLSMLCAAFVGGAWSGSSQCSSHAALCNIRFLQSRVGVGFIHGFDSHFNQWCVVLYDTVFSVARKYVLVDANEREERVMDGKMVIGMNKHREICTLQMTGSMLLLKEQVSITYFKTVPNRY